MQKDKTILVVGNNHKDIEVLREAVIAAMSMPITMLPAERPETMGEVMLKHKSKLFK